MIAAYPDTKVVLNVRRDLDAWHRSAVKNVVGINESRFLWWLCWWCSELFWMWHVYGRYLWMGLFRCADGRLADGIGRNGVWIYRGEYQGGEKG